MEIIKDFLNCLLHLDQSISIVTAHWGAWTYVLVFVIIFSETGLVVTPFLPGDSLLFVLGALAADGNLHLVLLIVVLSAAAVGGNMVNYTIGVVLAERVINHQHIPFVKQVYIQRTHTFFEKYGAKTIVITRFVPIIRTFAPFLAGVGSMPYGKFTLYNTIGGVLWVLVGTLSGYFFGNLPFVRQNFSLVILAIVVISLIPAVGEFLKHKNHR